MPDRWIDLEGVVNMRDVGGLPTSDGGQVASGRLLRSDNLQDLSEADIAHLVDVVGVRDIVDLRSNVEVHLEGPGPLRARDLAHHHHSLLTEDDRDDIAADALVLPWSKDSGRPRRPQRDDDYWASHYLGYLADRPDSVSAALKVVAQSQGATIVHCAAGKDRTGTVVALALDAAGVPHKAIIEDYALTAERIERIIARLMPRALYGNALRHQSVADQRPQPETMQTILDTVQSEFGGAAGWLREQGWQDSDIDRLRARLTS